MANRNPSLSQRIIAELKAFNKRLEVRLKRNYELLTRMKREEDFAKRVTHIKAFFSAK